MKIGIHTTELENARVDGTRVYVSELLKRFAHLAPQDDFYLYHKNDFNPVFGVPEAENYVDKKLLSLPAWTQTSFAGALWRDRPDVLWMPLHNLPRVRPQSMRTVVTVHDLAFKRYPEMFPRSDVRRLNLHIDYVAKNADHVIAVSESTKSDLLHFYPQLKEKNITVIHHGFDACAWHMHVADKGKDVLGMYGITGPYIVYVGAIQPRKNLITLIEAFERVKKTFTRLQLVCVGADAWMAQETHRRAESSPCKKDIIFTGGVPFDHVKSLLAGGEVFVLPALHEGFGIPVLEAFAAGVPVIAAESGSLPEVVGHAAVLFDPANAIQLSTTLIDLLHDEQGCGFMVAQGENRLQHFSWEKTARNTLEILL